MQKITLLFFSSLFIILMMNIKANAQDYKLQAFIADSSNLLCNGYDNGSAKVYALGGAGPYTYFWLPDSNNTDSDGNLWADTTYTIIVSDSLHDTATTYITLSQPSPLTISLASISNIRCSYDTDGRACVIGQGGISPYTYYWFPDGNTSACDSDMKTGSYTVLLTDSNGCRNKMQVNITSQSTVAAFIPTVTNVSCWGQFNGQTLVIPSGGISPYQFLWLPVGDTTQVANALGAGSYTIQVTDALGCKTFDTTAVQQPPPLVLTTAAIDSIAYAYVTGGTAPYTYAWYPGGSTNAFAAGLTPGIYTVTVRDSNLCFDSAIITITSSMIIPTLNIASWQGASTCGNPSYTNFVIYGAANDSTHFNNCVVDIYYPSAEYLGDSLANGGIIVTRGSDFLPALGNDYNIFDSIQLSDSVIELRLGSDTAASPNGTIIYYTTPKNLFQLSFKQRDCKAGQINFTNISTNDTLSYLTATNYLPITQLDSTVSYTVSSSFDTSWVVSYYTDTTGYTPISNNIQYNGTNFVNDVFGGGCPPIVTDFNSPVDAGVDSIVTISGANFGMTRGTGQVEFRDADSLNYYSKKMDNTDYISWTNNQIQIRLPSFVDSILSNKQSQSAVGGGNFYVKTKCGDSAISGNNLDRNPFSVYYNINQGWFWYHNDTNKPEKGEGVLRKVDTNGGYVLRLDSNSFPRNSNKRKIFILAVKDWVCYTGVNWVIGNDTTIAYNVNAPHKVYVNYVFFTSSLLDTFIVASTPLSIDVCPNSAQLEEGDMFFNGQKNFIYDSTGTMAIPPGYFDFYGICLHELGHLIGLRHDIVQGNLMYWNDNEGPISAIDRITLASSTAGSAVEGGLYSVHQSVRDTNGCNSESTMISQHSSCVNSTGIKQVQEINTFVMYPNPSNGTFIIESTVDHYVLVITNILGQRILTREIQNGKQEINITSVASGMYFVQAQYKNGITTKKLIITNK